MTTADARPRIVLLVEDSLTQALPVRHALEEAGYRVRHEADGESALRAARERAPDLIVSDVVMPRMNGYELCSACKADPALRHVPVILLTSMDAPIDLVRGLQAQADQYLLKPAEPTRLLDSVRALLAAPPRDSADEATPLELVVDGVPCRVRASRERVASLLLSAYETATRTKHDLLLAHDEIERNRQQLEDRVGERTRELTRANEVLQEAVRRLEGYDRRATEFIENVSHELRTPLAAVSLALTNLLKGVAGPLPDKAQTYLVMCSQECDRLKSTVADILDLERLDAQALQFHRMKLPLRSWARRAVERLRPKAEQKRISLALAGSDVAGFVDADPLKLERVILSVVQNAIRYTPGGGHVALDVHAIRDGAWVELTVTDDGPGIPPEHLPNVMKRFYRIGELVSGTGLGLALCKEILEGQGGEIELTSPPPGRPGGTRALIRMPLVSPPVVLAVDDSPTIQMLLRQHLKTHGYEPLICGSAEEVLSELGRTKPDILVVDAVLPGIDGVELVSRVKADRALRHIPIVMVTGAEVDGARRDTIEDYRIPVIAKPWTESELIACLEDAIYGKHYLAR